ncbi:Gfo/Idh/MocA family protein [Pseudogemmobacter sp. W21_MBD1_M6]|uniref:Gfo/Idh/MocA family protein n=1 Tax=Pseudogemmobacter sp. W21_MBD1_M6 TaxID=3240271 RepID=UPI003F971D2D
MRIMVVGAGSIGKRHHENLTSLGVDSVLCPYRDFASGAGKKTLESGEFDAMVIATATQIRMELVACCARLGLPFYVEKPLAYDADALSKILTCAQPVAERSMVGFMMRYHPAFRSLAQMDLSDIYSFSFVIGHDVRQWRQNWRFSESYAAKPEGGGVLLDLCHELDMATTLFHGATITATNSLGHAAYPGVDFATRISLCGGANRSGVTGNVEMDYLSPVSTRSATLRGLGKVIQFDFIRGSYSVDDGKGPTHLSLPHNRNDMFLAAMRDFLALVAGTPTSKVEHLPRLDLAAKSCAIIASAWEGRKFQGNITGEFA